MRRIKNVSLTVETQLSGKAKPRNINATLSQISNKFTTAPDIDLVTFLQTGKGSDGKDELDPGQAQKLCRNICNNQQIATSTASNDSGLFSVSFAYDTRYLPYEGTGAISDWQLDLPLTENPGLTTTAAKALSATNFINTLNMDGLIGFIRNISQDGKLAHCFHNEVMNRLKTNTGVDDLSRFVETMMGDPALNDWFNRFGKQNLNSMVKALTTLKQPALASKLSAYIDGVKRLPDTVQDAVFTDNRIMDISDVVLKVSYTAKDGGAQFRDKVRQLNAS
jgi:hypothetical protein